MIVAVSAFGFEWTNFANMKLPCGLLHDVSRYALTFWTSYDSNPKLAVAIAINISESGPHLAAASVDSASELAASIPIEEPLPSKQISRRIPPALPLFVPERENRSPQD